MDNSKKKCIRLTLEERHQIERLVKQGHSQNSIITLMRRSRHCISTEMKRGGGKGNYSAQLGQETASINGIRMTSKVRRVFSEKEVQQIHSLMDRNASRSVIRTSLSCSYAALDKWMAENYPHYKGGMVANLDLRLSNIEQQIEILFSLIKDMK